ncbi:hypothetical protein FE392_01910 [Xenorhabdus sp. 12]|uniref:Uncharacterized protein n=1 Tax=Xenorhabdus santafensis TaxID=2582833 RepID=A0ABU4S4F1_9GAMM|nr:hypothetical protein [Xenorhabdus sp. 12]MDX7986092.1 hypothetical protein [Xenorhabdus sp. 12]
MGFKLHRGGKGTNLNSHRLAPGERQEPLIIPKSIANRMFIKTVTGVNECSQQRGNLKDEGYN